MIRSAPATQYRYPGELYSNQQHTVDIYHTPVPHFSAILRNKQERIEKGKEWKSNLVQFIFFAQGWAQRFISYRFLKLNFNISSTPAAIDDAFRQAKQQRVEGNKAM